jgi:putative iron-dependent peroxidase
MEESVDQAAVDAALIGGEDAAFAGGSYAIVQVPRLEGMERGARREQEEIVGRTSSAVSARRRREAQLCPQCPDDNRGKREELQIVRAGTPFGEVE